MKHSQIFNLPNQLTSIRIVLAIVLVVVLEWARSLGGSDLTQMTMGTTGGGLASGETVGHFGSLFWLYAVAFILFTVASGTDWLDGYYARKYHLETTLGRILDPFADKMIICSTFTLLLTHAFVVNGPYGLMPWMVVVLISRELLITVIRGYVEGRGVNFGAKWVGKWKMGLQCVAAGGFIFCLAFGATGYMGVDTAGQLVTSHWFLTFAWWFTIASLWIAIILTIWSACTYIRAAIQISHQMQDD
ncbi:MAG: CDP-diacylglycerol--glycerol-3-phosphate 3-phosphatidyltransferase [Thermoguttaceae bacterium]|nr:CDP-diacylglycerol--glycerol-3-phosphate 3-phosphatidyltransferase [Thermoguttaceae bacterium]